MGVFLDMSVRGAAILLSGLFAAAVFHKVQLLATRSAVSEPLIQVSEWRRTYAAPIIFAALIVELSVAVFLVVEPAWGLTAAAILTAFYAYQMRHLPRNASCRCFGSLTRARSRFMAVRRNVFLAILSGVGSIGYAAGAVHDVRVTDITIGIALIAGAAVSAPAALGAFGLSPGSQTPNPEEG